MVSLRVSAAAHDEDSCWQELLFVLMSVLRLEVNSLSSWLLALRVRAHQEEFVDVV